MSKNKLTGDIKPILRYDQHWLRYVSSAQYHLFTDLRYHQATSVMLNGKQLAMVGDHLPEVNNIHLFFSKRKSNFEDDHRSLSLR